MQRYIAESHADAPRLDALLALDDGALKALLDALDDATAKQLTLGLTARAFGRSRARLVEVLEAVRVAKRQFGARRVKLPPWVPEAARYFDLDATDLLNGCADGGGAADILPDDAPEF